MRHVFLAAAIGLAAAGQAAADDIALVIGNKSYNNPILDVNGADDVARLVRDLRRQGFAVDSATNADAEAMLRAARLFAGRAGDADRILVVLNGAFLSAGDEAFLLPSDAPADLGALDLPGAALDVSLLMEIVEASPARPRTVLIGTDARERPVPKFLQAGVGSLPAEAGVPVVTGSPAGVVELARGTLLEAGATLDGDEVPRGLTATGLPNSGLTFTEAPPRGEATAWAQAEAADTEAAYRRYLSLYPQGERAGVARGRLEAIAGAAAGPARAPEGSARAGEEDLGLGRDARRAVQQALTLLGYDTRGVDGVFGPGTRDAIAAWQAANRYPRTGYLTAAQLAALSEQSTARAAAAEAEDRAYWRITGASGRAADLRAYLGRYPQGLYARAARDDLARIEGNAAGTGALADSLAWDEARAADTERAYRLYLDRYPQGAFTSEAQRRIGEIRAAAPGSGGASGGGAGAAAQAEAALGLNAITGRLIEQRLESLGLQPGTVDGSFDAQTREAIRAFQESRGLPGTGYVDQTLVAALLADAIFNR